MGGEWPFVSLEDSGVQLYDCVHKTPEAVDQGVPYIGIPQMKNGHIDFSANPRLISHDDYLEWTKKLAPRKYDVVLSRRCNPGETAIVKENSKFALGQNLVILRSEGTKVIPEFLRWMVQGPYWWAEVERYINVGAVFDSLRCANIPQFKVPLPPLPKQRAIAHILGSLDDKIELNRKMNTTLEEMAQALFQSWFVDFDPVIDKALAAGDAIPEPLAAKARRRAALGDRRKALPAEVAALFPDRFVETAEMGWVPEGWGIGKLFDYIQMLGGGTPQTTVDEYWNGDIMWFSVVDAPNNSDVFVIDTEKRITQLGIQNSSANLLPKGTTIISARGTVGKCAMVAEPMAMNQSCYGIRGRNGIGDIYNYYSVRHNVADLASRGHGSVFNTITRDTFKSISMAFGGTALTQMFDKAVKPNFDRILNNCHQNNSLTQLRDTLLPKLISGELRLGEVRDIVKNV